MTAVRSRPRPPDARASNADLNSVHRLRQAECADQWCWHKRPNGADQWWWDKQPAVADRGGGWRPPAGGWAKQLPAGGGGWARLGRGLCHGGQHERDAEPVLVGGPTVFEPSEAEHQQERAQVKRELNQAEQELESLKRLRAEVKDEPDE